MHRLWDIQLYRNFLDTLYNDLPAEMKHCDRIEPFKRMLKEYILFNVI